MCVHEWCGEFPKFSGLLESFWRYWQYDEVTGLWTKQLKEKWLGLVCDGVKPGVRAKLPCMGQRGCLVGSSSSM